MMTRSELEARLEREYAQTRERHEAERRARNQEVFARDPQIARLREELSAAFARGAHQLVGAQSEAESLVTGLRAQVAQNGAQVAERLAALGYPADYLELRFDCEKCRDTGFIGELRNLPCECRQRRERELAYGALDVVQASFERFDASIYPSAEQREQAEAARDLCMRYADALPFASRLNLILMGDSGLGKTFLLDCVARRAMERGVAALRATAFRMLEAMRAYHFGENSGESAFSRMLECDFLLIDDLGTEPMLRNISIEYLFVLLNERAATRRPTVLATNLRPAELKERYNERVLSRLMDRTLNCHIRLTGQDLRFREVRS